MNSAIANIIRYRGESPQFIDAFETKSSREYQNEAEDASIVACGPMVPEAMRAAWLLKKDYGIETRVINMHTIKPLDSEALVAAAAETQLVLTVEEHQKGGFGNLVAGAILRERKDFAQPLLLDMIGIEDRFGLSGKPWELLQYFGLTAENIAERLLKLYARKRALDYPKPKSEAIMDTIECSQCHSRVSLDEYLRELPMPTDELCVECERHSRAGCAECQSRWMRENSAFTFVCRECREVVVPG